MAGISLYYIFSELEKSGVEEIALLAFL